MCAFGIQIVCKAVIIVNQLMEIVSTSGSRPRVRDPLTLSDLPIPLSRESSNILDDSLDFIESSEVGYSPVVSSRSNIYTKRLLWIVACYITFACLRVITTRSTVMRIMYYAQRVRPDILCTVNFLSTKTRLGTTTLEDKDKLTRFSTSTAHLQMALPLVEINLVTYLPLPTQMGHMEYIWMVNSTLV